MRHLKPTSTLAQLKHLIHLCWARQCLFIDIAVLECKKADLGTARILDQLKCDIATAINARIANYREKEFEIPTEWEDAQSLAIPIGKLVNEKYKRYLATHADPILDKEAKEARAKVKVDKAKTKCEEAGPKVALVATIRQVSEDGFKKLKGNNKQPVQDFDAAAASASRVLDAKGYEAARQDGQMQALLSPPPWLQVDPAEAYVVKANPDTNTAMLPRYV